MEALRLKKSALFENGRRMMEGIRARTFLIALALVFTHFSIANCTEDFGWEYSFHCFSKNGHYAIVSRWGIQTGFVNLQVLKIGYKKPVEIFTPKGLKIPEDDLPYLEEGIEIPKWIINKYQCFDYGFISKTSQNKKFKIVFKEGKIWKGKAYEGFEYKKVIPAYFSKLYIYLKTKHKSQLIKSLLFPPSTFLPDHEFIKRHERINLKVAWSRNNKSFIVFGSLFSAWPGYWGFDKPSILSCRVK